MTQTPQALPSENVQRGTIFALLIVPAGIIAWLLLWSIGWVASIVALGVAIGAVFLYRFGSGGRVGRTGAITVTVITIGTLLLSFFAGLVLDIGKVFVSQQGVTWIEALTGDDFWRVFSTSVSSGFGSVAGSFAIALVFGALGCFSVLRAAFAESKTEVPAADAPVVEPEADAAK